MSENDAFQWHYHNWCHVGGWSPFQLSVSWRREVNKRVLAEVKWQVGCKWVFKASHLDSKSRARTDQARSGTLLTKCNAKSKLSGLDPRWELDRETKEGKGNLRLSCGDLLVWRKCPGTDHTKQRSLIQASLWVCSLIIYSDPKKHKSP